MDKILIIDDEKPTLHMFRLFLNAYGYQVLTAESGEEGIQVFQNENPPFVLTDVKMPGMDGIEVLKRIKEIEPMTEVIVITGHGDMDLAIKALSLDATDFINKPIQRHALDQALKRAKGRLNLARSDKNEVEVKIRKDAVIIQILGNVNSGSEEALGKAWDEAANAEKQKIVILFSHNSAINGAGIAILTQLLLDSRKKGLNVVMAGLSENFSKMFDIAGITKLVKIHPALEDALAD
ncbi:response regulator [Desulfobacterales bacterium HSG16]|nr:response regulator [Desulfobacterales bacterium HSG16]